MLTRDEFREVLREVLTSDGIEEHTEHHAWIRQRIAREKAKVEFWSNLAAKSLPLLLWSAIAAIGTAIWNLVTKHWHW